MKQTNFEVSLQAELDALREAGLFRSLRTVDSAQGPVISIGGKEYLNFSSNDYLGLANHPRLRAAARAAIESFGVGAGASRLVCGNSRCYDLLEAALAEFKRKEAAIVFSSGYAANVGTICALVGEGDTVIIDKLCHASIIDGCRQSGATLRIYPHKNLKKLEDLLQQARGASKKGVSQASVLVITETVYSMDGDLAPLPEIVELKDRYDAWLMIDEAHAAGIFGRHGRGVAEHFAVEDRVEVTLGTLSKALACVGGYIAGSRTLIDYLRNKARSLIYSTALPPSMCAAGAEAVRLVMSDEARVRREVLWRNVQQMKDGLAKQGISAVTESAILPILVGGEEAALGISQRLFERGMFVSAIRYPTVAKGKARLRVTMTAAHTGDHIERFLENARQAWNASGS